MSGQQIQMVWGEKIIFTVYPATPDQKKRYHQVLEGSMLLNICVTIYHL